MNVHDSRIDWLSLVVHNHSGNYEWTEGLVRTRTQNSSEHKVLRIHE